MFLLQLGCTVLSHHEKDVRVSLDLFQGFQLRNDAAVGIQPHLGCFLKRRPGQRRNSSAVGNRIIMGGTFRSCDLLEEIGTDGLIYESSMPCFRSGSLSSCSFGQQEEREGETLIGIVSRHQAQTMWPHRRVKWPWNQLMALSRVIGGRHVGLPSAQSRSVGGAVAILLL